MDYEQECENAIKNIENINKQIRHGTDFFYFAAAITVISAGMLYVNGHEPFSSYVVISGLAVYLAGQGLQWNAHRRLNRMNEIDKVR